MMTKEQFTSFVENVRARYQLEVPSTPIREAVRANVGEHDRELARLHDAVWSAMDAVVEHVSRKREGR